jgi:Domain of unknown function (DUF4157)
MRAFVHKPDERRGGMEGGSRAPRPSSPAKWPGGLWPLYVQSAPDHTSAVRADGEVAPEISKRLSYSPPGTEPGRAKLAEGSPAEILEQEADRIAAHVTETPAPSVHRSCGCGGTCGARRAGKNASEHYLQREARQPGSAPQTGIPPIVGRVLVSRGEPLDRATRDYVEPRFGRNFGGVRVHTDARAAESARAVDATAYTVGNQVVFDSGRFAPNTEEGRRLLAHELTHVVQQSHGDGQGRLQRQPRVGAAWAPRTTTYSFVGCTDTQMETLTRNIQQSYVMVVNAREQMTNLILSVIQAESSGEYSLSADGIVLRRVIGRLFGSDSLEVLRAVRDNFTRIANRYRADREVICHNDPDRHPVASAEIGGTRIWIGPWFFSRYGDNLDARPRIFIHEVAHNAGIEHDMVGIAITAGETETRPAQVAHHADSYAELAYRIFTRDFLGRLNRELDI